MKTALVLVLGLLTLNSFAQSRGQVLEDIRSWSESVANETYSSQASTQDLHHARQLLEQAHTLLAGGRSTNDIICSRASFGYAPVNSATGFQYGEDVSTLGECRRMLPARGAKALCVRARFGYQHMTIDRGQYIGESNFSTLDECLELAPVMGQVMMCARARFGYIPYNLQSLLSIGESVPTSTECLQLLPERGSNLMCIRVNFGYQAVNITNGRGIGARTSTLSECHRLINRGGM